mmetsp:Transcript_19240/g.30752  ORF Transcript_19240/g.30752 Transcript_19240/m.30752 type:complete len:90 (-) Transcript_19240:102-371(-)
MATSRSFTGPTAEAENSVNFFHRSRQSALQQEPIGPANVLMRSTKQAGCTQTSFHSEHAVQPSGSACHSCYAIHDMAPQSCLQHIESAR